MYRVLITQLSRNLSRGRSNSSSEGNTIFSVACVKNSVHRGGWGLGGYPSMHYRWYPSIPCSKSPGGYLSMPCRWYPSMPCRSRRGGGSPGPHPGGKLRGLARGVGESPGPHLGGFSRPTPRGAFSRPTSRGCLQTHTWGRGVCIPACTEADPTWMGQYASYWNAFLLVKISEELQYKF